MIRTQVQLTDEQARKLREIAADQGVSMAEVVREAVDRALAEHDRRERRRRALSVLGRFGGDASDVAANHDKYLDEAYLS